MAITPTTSSLTGVGFPSASPSSTPADGTGFSDALQKLVGSVESSAGEANDAIGKMLDGTGEVHDAMIAVQKADMMLQLTVQVRNKLVQAYQDIMRMPV